MQDVPPHHLAWLEKHGHTIEELNHFHSLGFHIHHINGNHNDNDHENLVLIHGDDHMRLHNSGTKLVKFHGRLREGWMTKEEADRKKLEIGKIAYEMRLEGYAWNNMEDAIGRKSGNHYAKLYCLANDIPWPMGIKATKKRARKPQFRL